MHIHFIPSIGMRRIPGSARYYPTERRDSIDEAKYMDGIRCTTFEEMCSSRALAFSRKIDLKQRMCKLPQNQILLLYMQCP